MLTRPAAVGVQFIGLLFALLTLFWVIVDIPALAWVSAALAAILLIIGGRATREHMRKEGKL